MLAKSLDTLKKSRVLNAQFNLFWDNVKAYMRFLCCPKHQNEPGFVEDTFDSRDALDEYLDTMSAMFLCPFEEREKDNLTMEVLLAEKYGEDSDELYLYVACTRLVELIDTWREQVQKDTVLLQHVTAIKISRLVQDNRLCQILFDNSECESCVTEDDTQNESEAAKQDVHNEDDAVSDELIPLNERVSLRRYVDDDGDACSGLVLDGTTQFFVCEREQEEDMVRTVVPLVMRHLNNDHDENKQQGNTDRSSKDKTDGPDVDVILHKVLPVLWRIIMQ